MTCNQIIIIIMKHEHQKVQSGIFFVVCDYCFILLSCLITVLTWVQLAKRHSEKHPGTHLFEGFSVAGYVTSENWHPQSQFSPHVKSLQNLVHIKRRNIWNILSNSTSLLLRLSGIFTPSLSSLLIADSRQYGKVQVTSKVVLKLGFESQRDSSAALRCHLM